MSLQYDCESVSPAPEWLLVVGLHLEREETHPSPMVIYSNHLPRHCRGSEQDPRSSSWNARHEALWCWLGSLLIKRCNYWAVLRIQPACERYLKKKSLCNVSVV